MSSARGAFGTDQSYAVPFNGDQAQGNAADHVVVMAHIRHCAMIEGQPLACLLVRLMDTLITVIKIRVVWHVQGGEKGLQGGLDKLTPEIARCRSRA